MQRKVTRSIHVLVHLIEDSSTCNFSHGHCNTPSDDDCGNWSLDSSKRAITLWSHSVVFKRTAVWKMQALKDLMPKCPNKAWCDLRSWTKKKRKEKGDGTLELVALWPILRDN